MRQWGELSPDEKSKKIKIIVVAVIVAVGAMGMIAYMIQPKGYVPEKDTTPVFGQDR